MGKWRKQQQSSHQETDQRKRDYTPSRTIHLDISPGHLIEKGNIQGTVDFLKPDVAQHPTHDLKRRLLGNCLFDLGQYREAAETLQALQEKNWADHTNIGVAYIHVQEWGQAIPWLEASLQQHEEARTYYLLALAYLSENSDDAYWYYSTDPDRLQHVVNLLQHARVLPACPSSAYLLLNDQLWSLAYRKPAEGREERNRELDAAREECYHVIEEAFAMYPDEVEVRLEYVKGLVQQQKYEAALMILPPLINHDESMDTCFVEEAIAYAIEAAIRGELYEKALQYIETLPVPSSAGRPDQASLLKLKGDLLLYQGKFDAARKCYEQEMQSDAFIDKFLGTFSSAWAWLQQGELERCRVQTKVAATYWFHQKDKSDQLYAMNREPMMLGTVFVGGNPAYCIKQVCQQLLQDDVSLDLEFKGQLSYLLYTYTAAPYQMTSPPEEHKAMLFQLLRQAAQWYPHPLISGDLQYMYLDMNDLPQAIEQHLRYSIFLFTSAPETFEEEYVEFARSSETITTDEERKVIHAAAWRQLQACKDTVTLEAVFRVFFDAFWRSLLQDGAMYQELVEVTRLLIARLYPGNSLWFYHAWGLSKLGRDEESERTYRHYVAHAPNDADALHNLALLVEKKGLFQEALLLSNKAVALAPEDEIIVQGNSRLKRAYEERAHACQEEESRGQGPQWTLFSDSQKWLLCLIALHPSPHWSALLPHIKQNEQQLRQLQEDWEQLVTQRACLQTEEDSPMRVVPLLLPCLQSEGFRHWLVAEIARVQARKKKDLWLPAATDLDDEHLSQLTPVQRSLLHQALMRKIDRISDAGLTQLHLFFYRRVWKALLIEWNMHAELVDLCTVFLERLTVMSRQELWECAYYATDLTTSPYLNLAEKLYKKYLEQEETRATYHNLALIYTRRKQYQDALQMIEHALRLAPSHEGSQKQKTSIVQAIRHEEEQRQQRELEMRKQQEQHNQYLQELEQKITAHRGEVDYYKQRILQAVKEAPYYSTKRSLAQQLRMEDWAFEGHWKKLVAWGMILEEGKRIGSLHPLVRSYLERGWPVPLASSMRTVVIHPAAGSLTKPVFGSKQEYKLYTVFLEIFHGQLVFPNMALQAIFPYQKMKDVLTKEEFNYYMVSSVDICITRTTSYFPLVAFEVDGPHHEHEERQRKDALKNAIFEKGGLGLIRLQIGYQPLSTKEVWEDVREKINQALYLWRSDPTRKGWVEDIETELGIVKYPKSETLE